MHEFVGVLIAASVALEMGASESPFRLTVQAKLPARFYLDDGNGKAYVPRSAIAYQREARGTSYTHSIGGTEVELLCNYRP